jgi:hypothetical protein
MTVTPYDPTPAWAAGARYTASGETPVRIANLNVETKSWIGYATTVDDTAPTIDRAYAIPVAPGGVKDITLADTERLWPVEASP